MEIEDEAGAPRCAGGLQVRREAFGGIINSQSRSAMRRLNGSSRGLNLIIGIYNDISEVKSRQGGRALRRRHIGAASAHRFNLFNDIRAISKRAL